MNLVQRILTYRKDLVINKVKTLSICSSSKYYCTSKEENQENEYTKEKIWPKKIFSGIQPTGSIHIGNYFGAIKKWQDLQNSKEDVTFCIVDLHSITLPQDPSILRHNILQLTATMLACGIDPNISTLYVQSSVKQHTELMWILGCLSTMARLGHLPQYKEKTKKLKEIPLGLFVYPVLQAADILLYKATHVPVGEDQLQHIQLCQHLAKIFNFKFGTTFPHCHAVMEDKQAGRILSLRDPTKKMSKSDPDPKSAVFLTDRPEQILEKVKKAITDFTSEVTFDADVRPGVSNLIAIHSYVSGKSIEEICEEAWGIDTGKYKVVVADALIEHINPIREKIDDLMQNKDFLVYSLELGKERATAIAEQTMTEVKGKVGLGGMGESAITKKLLNKL